VTQRYATLALLYGLIADDHTGAWSSEEEARLTQVMQTMEEQGKSADNTPKFWKAVSEHLDGTWTHDQCREKWISKSGGQIHWRDTDTKSLVKKYVSAQLSD
jgi:hypothetical protein